MGRLAAALVVLLLAGCSADPPAPVTAAPSVVPSPAAPASTETAGSEGGVVLGGEDLGVTRVGAPVDEAVAALTAVLGEPDEDPAASTACPGADREVRWDDFRVAVRDGRLVGWASTSPTLQTPSGIARGTAVAELQRVLGDRLRRAQASPDAPPGFAVEGVDVLGTLSSAGDDAVVTALHSSACAGP